MQIDAYFDMCGRRSLSPTPAWTTNPTRRSGWSGPGETKERSLAGRLSCGRSLFQHCAGPVAWIRLRRLSFSLLFDFPTSLGLPILSALACFENSADNRRPAITRSAHRCSDTGIVIGVRKQSRSVLAFGSGTHASSISWRSGRQGRDPVYLDGWGRPGWKRRLSRLHPKRQCLDGRPCPQWSCCMPNDVRSSTCKDRRGL